MSPEPIVFIVDDDPSFRKSLVWLLESADIRVQSYSSAHEFLDSCDLGRPCCLILDVRMPKMGGLDLLDELVTRDIHIPVIIVTAYGDVPTAVRAMKNGAVDIFEKPFSDQMLLDRVQQCLKKDIRNREEQAMQAEVMQRLTLLTPRQRQVMDLVVAGKSNKEIARQLDRSIKTVEAHRAAVMNKTRAVNLAELVQLVRTGRHR